MRGSFYRIAGGVGLIALVCAIQYYQHKTEQDSVGVKAVDNQELYHFYGSTPLPAAVRVEGQELVVTFKPGPEETSATPDPASCSLLLASEHAKADSHAAFEQWKHKSTIATFRALANHSDNGVLEIDAMPFSVVEKLKPVPSGAADELRYERLLQADADQGKHLVMLQRIREGNYLATIFKLPGEGDAVGSEGEKK